MRIHGTKPLLNAYNNQVQNKRNTTKSKSQSDKINISDAAQKLHGNDTQINEKRMEYVQEIKQIVESGDYKVNYNRTAQKMIEFWSK